MWVKNRKKEGLKSVSDMDQEDLAKEVFKAWDNKMHRYLTIEQMAENFIGLGLAPDIQFVRDIVQALKSRNDANPD